MKSITAIYTIENINNATIVENSFEKSLIQNSAICKTQIIGIIIEIISFIGCCFNTT